MKRSMFLLIVISLFGTACGEAETRKENSTTGFTFEERAVCDDFRVCFDTHQSFDTSFAYLSERDGIDIELKQNERPLEAVHGVFLFIPWDVPVGEPQPVDSDATPGVRASILYNLRGFSSPNPSDAGGTYIVRSISETSIEIEFRDLNFKQDGDGIFLLRDATLNFDCIGEKKGSGCGSYTDIDQCGVERSFSTDDDCFG